MPIPRLIAAALMVACLSSPVLSQPIRTEVVQFAPGTSGTVISGRIKGYDSVDYTLGAGAGQRMVVDLQTSNLSNYFNVMAPGADAAMFIGAAEGTHFDGILPVGGQYTIRVFLMRNAARREESADYKLSIHIGGAITPPAPEAAPAAPPAPPPPPPRPARWWLHPTR